MMNSHRARSPDSVNCETVLDYFELNTREGNLVAYGLVGQILWGTLRPQHFASKLGYMLRSALATISIKLLVVNPCAVAVLLRVC